MICTFHPKRGTLPCSSVVGTRTHTVFRGGGAFLAFDAALLTALVPFFSFGSGGACVDNSDSSLSGSSFVIDDNFGPSLFALVVFVTAPENLKI